MKRSRAEPALFKEQVTTTKFKKPPSFARVAFAVTYNKDIEYAFICTDCSSPEKVNVPRSAITTLYYLQSVPHLPNITKASQDGLLTHIDEMCAPQKEKSLQQLWSGNRYASDARQNSSCEDETVVCSWISISTFFCTSRSLIKISKYLILCLYIKNSKIKLRFLESVTKKYTFRKNILNFES